MNNGVYDKAKYHFDGDFPSELDIKQAYVHTGFYLAWLIQNNLINESFTEEISDEINSFKNQKITGPELFYRIDGVLAEDMLNEEGNQFSEYYFDFEKGQYLSDYEKLLGKEYTTLYHVKDTWGNYEIIKKRVDYQYKQWKKNKDKKRW